MRPESTVVEVRGTALALAELASPVAARPIAETMRKNGYIGFSRRSVSELKPLGGYNLGFDDDFSIRELALARALYACGDYEGLARKILEAYSADPRSHFAVYAKAVLNQQGIMRANGNKKGIFTRQRQPKDAAFHFRARWTSLPLDYKGNK